MRPAGLIHLLIADDHPVVQYGLRAAVAGAPDIMVIDAVASLTELLDRCRTDPPDVILLDLRLGGAEPDQAVTLIRSECPAARILMLSTDEAGDDLCRALDAGRPILPYHKPGSDAGSPAPSDSGRFRATHSMTAPSPAPYRRSRDGRRSGDEKDDHTNRRSHDGN